MTERWLTAAEAIDAVKAHVGGSVGRSRKILQDARASGEVRIRNDDPVLLIADDGVVGMNLRPGTMNKAGVTANGKLVTHPLAVAVREFSEEDLADWLSRNHARANPPSPRGRRAKADWDAVGLALQQEVLRRGFPSEDNDDPTWRRKADAERWVTELLEQRNEPLGEARIREKVTELLKRIEAGN
jgi:hypothetical protein